MLPYQKQLQYKQKQVYDNLKRIGKVALPDMQPIVGSAETRFYRNKLEYTFSTKEYLPKDAFIEQKEKENFSAEHPKGVLGFHAKGFFDKVVDIKKCWLQHDLTNDIR